MKTFKEYYDRFLAEEMDWLGQQDNEWWRPAKERWLGVQGEYLETVHILPIEEKNDVSLFHNHTNVKNIKWGILFSMLAQALIDWCKEKDLTWEDLWSYSIIIKKTIENGRVTYIYRHSLRNHNDHEWEYETDEKRNELFDGLDDFLCDLFDRFLEDNMPDVPLDWNWFSFSLDSLTESVKYGEWVPASDGSMNLGNYNEETKEYDEYVECM